MRLIDADALYQILESCEIRKASLADQLTEWDYGYTAGIERAESETECAPTVDAIPVIHGKWIDEGQYADFFPHHAFCCSVCGHHLLEIEVNYDYCPYCGAKMDAERKEE